ncbi:MAG: hypothetical protein J6Z46_04980 [Lachnospiraceae bacterium]|nr:hypothetical protein [Lachnospiraceae bacterium]MBP5249343.1 hypothetical protein [Lachnospiraceae bacterium]
METIKNYLETMFAGLPNTADVIRAKEELGQMMEDKYQELIADGKSQNEAVGTVISEFGNLDELAEDLGIKTVVNDEKTVEANLNRRHISFDEAKRFLREESTRAMLRAFGVAFCIASVIMPIMGDAVFGNDGMIDNLTPLVSSAGQVASFGGMMLFIIIGVVLFVISGSIGRRWDFLRRENCFIDYSTANYVKDESTRAEIPLTIMNVLGIVLCAISWMPAAMLDAFEDYVPVIDLGDISGAALFFFVAIGVLLIVASNSLRGRYVRLLEVNDDNTVSGKYKESEDEVSYENPTVSNIMSVYWPTVTGIYLIWSFLTFDWHITWIVWVVAAIIKKVVDVNLGSRK